jgi:hypothetical protein
MTRRLGAALIAVCGAALALTALLSGSAHAQPSDGSPPVVVIGVPGLRWADLGPSTTPTLWRLAARSAVGSLSIRAGRPRTCPVDGWFVLGSGNRARGTDPHPHGCVGAAVTLPVHRPRGTTGATVDVGPVQRDNDALHFDTTIGALALSLRHSGECVTAVGPGAAVAAAEPDGQVPSYAAKPTIQALARCPVTIVGADALVAGDTPQARRNADNEVATALAAAPPGAVVILLGVSEVDDIRPHLHVAMVSGPGFRAGRILRSGTTRRAPYVQLTDIAPTILHLRGVRVPDDMTGRPVTAVGGGADTVGARVHALVDTDRAAISVSRLVPPFFAFVVATQFALYVLAGAALLRTSTGERWRRRIRRGTCVVAVAYAGAPVATYLANLYPWWRADHPLVAVLISEFVWIAILAVLAHAGPWRRHRLGPVGFVAAATALVLAGDILTGSRLQMSSLLGYSPIVAGRFVGFGNVAFALFGTSALLASMVLFAGRSRRTTLIGVALVGLVCVIIDGGPWFGSDFGGVLALVPAFAVLGMVLTRGRILWTRLVAASLAGVVAVSTLALIDYARPAEDRTHLGRFVAQIRDGTAGTIIHRKADANLHVLTHNILGLIVPVSVVFLAVLLRRPTGGLLVAYRRMPELRAGLFATFALGLVGFAVNDSGVAIPALSMTVAIPVAIAGSIIAVEEEHAASTADATVASGPPEGPVRPGASGRGGPGGC